MPDDEFTQEVIEYLQGSCKSLDEGITVVIEYSDHDRFKDYSEAEIDHSMVDDAIFVCADCGWWCEAGDWGEETTDNGDVCSSCWQDNHVIRCNECHEPQDDCECTQCNECGDTTNINEVDGWGVCPSCVTVAEEEAAEEEEDCPRCCQSFHADEINWQGNCHDCQYIIDEEEEEQIAADEEEQEEG